MDKNLNRSHSLHLVSLPNPPQPRNRPVRWQRDAIENIFDALDITYKPSCKACGQPFYIERLTGNPDTSAYCPTCKPRPDLAANEGARCDCGNPTLIIARLEIHPNPTPGDLSHTRRDWYPLCAICAMVEAMTTLQTQVEKVSYPPNIRKRNAHAIPSHKPY